MWWLDDEASTDTLSADEPSTSTEPEVWAELRQFHQLQARNSISHDGDNGDIGDNGPNGDNGAVNGSAEPPSESAPAGSTTEQHAAEIERRLAAEARLVDAASQHAAELAALRLQIAAHEEAVKRTELARDAETKSLRSQVDSLQASLKKSEASRANLEAAVEQRESAHTEDLAVLTQFTAYLQAESQAVQARLARADAASQELAAARGQRDLAQATERAGLVRALQEADDALRESASRRASETETFQAELRTSRQALAASETARGELQVAADRRNEMHAQSEQALRIAVRRADERADEQMARVAAGEQESAALRSLLERERVARSAVESDLRATRCQHATESASLSAEMQALRRAAHEAEVASAAQFDKVDRARQTAERGAREAQARIQSLRDEVSSWESRAEAETRQRVDTEYELAQCRAAHAAELARLQARIQVLDKKEALQREADAAAEQRETECARVLVETQEIAQQRADQLVARERELSVLRANLATEKQSRANDENQRRDLERQHARQTEAIQSRLQEVEQLARVHAAERDEAAAALKRTREARATELARASAARAAVETELRRLTGQLDRQRAETNKFRGDYDKLHRDRTKQCEKLDADVARLRQELEDRKQEIHERDELVANQIVELQRGQEAEQLARLRHDQLAARHAEQIASFETQVALLQSRAEVERASRIRVEDEQTRRAEDLTRQLDEASQQSEELARQLDETNQKSEDLTRQLDEASQQSEQFARHLDEEKHQRSRSQCQVAELQAECVRRKHELDASREVSKAALQAEEEARRQIEQRIEQLQALDRELATTRSSAAERETLRAEELVRVRAELTGETSKRKASQTQVEQLQQQLSEANQRGQQELERRERTEASANQLEQAMVELQKQADAFHGLAQRHAAARRKLEADVKRAVDGADREAALRVTRANIEVNDRIRRLTTELESTRNQSLAIRQQAGRKIKLAQDEIQRLKQQLHKVQEAA